jgi:hypothetical protein
VVLVCRSCAVLVPVAVRRHLPVIPGLAASLFPPRKQWLTAAVGGTVVVVVIIRRSSSFSPPRGSSLSSPRPSHSHVLFVVRCSPSCCPSLSGAGSFVVVALL